MKGDITQWSFYVAAGDLLLLNGENKMSVWNKAGQTVRTGEFAKFTHVAIVITANLIVDAMPNKGVRFREWSEIEKTYNVAQSVVARNADLARDNATLDKALSAASFYFAQPFRLASLLNRSSEIRDKSGIVCSQFAALVMRHLGANVADCDPVGTLPVHIQRFTNGKNGWRQFAMDKYGLYSKCEEPPLESEFWIHLHNKLIENGRHMEKCEVVEESLSSVSTNDFQQRIDTLRSQRLAIKPEDLRRTIERQTAAVVIKCTEDAHTFSGQLRDLNAKLIQYLDSLENHPLIGDLDSKHVLAPGTIDFLDQCRQLFLLKDFDPSFLHDVDAPDVCKFLRERLMINMKEFEALGKQLREAVGWMAVPMREVARQASEGRVHKKSLILLNSMVTQLLGPETVFSGVEPELLKVRLASYTAVFRELDDLRKSLSTGSYKMALEAFTTAFEIDSDRIIWVTRDAPALAAWREASVKLFGILNSGL